jgi:hypothetical protein
MTGLYCATVKCGVKIDWGTAVPQVPRRTLIVTNCTSIKAAPPEVFCGNLPTASLAGVATAWISLLSQCGDAKKYRPLELYRGRSVSLALEAAGILDADISVVSAGLGYLRADASIPSYDLSVSDKALRSRVKGKFDYGLWWNQISEGPFSSSAGEDLASRQLVLVSLSGPYLRLFADQLAGLDRSNMRIFGKSPASAIPVCLHQFVLPYDSRLESVGRRGTTFDFSQRALLHYAECVSDPLDPSLDRDRKVVLEFMNEVKMSPRGPKRPSVDDATIISTIRRLIPSLGRRKSSMLQHLRRVEGIACEQNRFGRLFDEANSEPK